MALQRPNSPLEFIRNIQLMRIKQQQNHVGSFGEPFDDGSEVVASLEALFFAREDAGGVDYDDVFEDGGGEGGDLEF